MLKVSNRMKTICGRQGMEVLNVPVITGFSIDIKEQAVYGMVTLHHVLNAIRKLLKRLLAKKIH